ncbi:hypothetical protein FKM82_009029 [Ascaphus truei]
MRSLPPLLLCHLQQFILSAHQHPSGRPPRLRPWYSHLFPLHCPLFDHGFNVHFFADDILIHFSFPLFSPELSTHTSACLSTISTRMSSH